MCLNAFVHCLVKFHQVARRLGENCVGSCGLVQQAGSRAQHYMLGSTKDKLSFCSSILSPLIMHVRTRYQHLTFTYVVSNLHLMGKEILPSFFRENSSAFSRITQLV